MQRVFVGLLAATTLMMGGTVPVAAQVSGGPARADFETDQHWRSLATHRDAIEWEMVDEINLARTRRGLRPLRVQVDIRAVARAWSQVMSTSDSQYHNPLYARQIGDWSLVGENIWGIAYGGSHVMHEGFMDSPGHRANILSPAFDEVGVGIVFNQSTKKWWTTVNFRARRAGTRPAAEPARPRPRPVGREFGVVPVRDRIAGTDRIDTALTLSGQFAGADRVVLAREDNFADALAGGPLAAAVGGPLLLNPAGRLDRRVAAEVDRLGASTVYLAGGTVALSPKVERALARTGVDVVRLAGRDRFETAAVIAAETVAHSDDFRGQVFVADGVTGWPDALAASARASASGSPLLLVGGGTVPRATKRMLREWASQDGPYGGQAHVRVTVVGGEGVVSAGQHQTLEMLEGDVSVGRVAGADRYATSAAAAGMTAAPTQWSASSTDQVVPVWVATGRNWPDALAAGPAAAKAGAKLVLVDGHDPMSSRPSTLGLSDNRHLISSVTPVGGAAVFTDAAVASLQNRMR